MLIKLIALMLLGVIALVQHYRGKIIAANWLYLVFDIGAIYLIIIPLLVLAAVLAVLGYSVNESVIIFDRVREKFRERHARNMTTAQVLDHAITTTTSRTVITHTSTLMMVLSMLFFGGPTLHYFSLALAIGICFGVYSSIFVAAAIVMRLGLKREDLVKPVKKKDATEVELP